MKRQREILSSLTPCLWFAALAPFMEWYLGEQGSCVTDISLIYVGWKPSPFFFFRTGIRVFNFQIRFDRGSRDCGFGSDGMAWRYCETDHGLAWIAKGSILTAIRNVISRVNENRIVIRMCSRQNRNMSFREFEFPVGIRNRVGVASLSRLMFKPWPWTKVNLEPNVRFGKKPAVRKRESLTRNHWSFASRSTGDHWW